MGRKKEKEILLSTKLLELPRDVGKHPELADMITAGIGRFGPYLKIGPRL